jgi:hypothetical protein
MGSKIFVHRFLMVRSSVLPVSAWCH